jgi:hypothetical protein
LHRIVHWGGGKTDKSIIKWRRALVALASAGGNDVATIARAGLDVIPVSVVDGAAAEE